MLKRIFGFLIDRDVTEIQPDSKPVIGLPTEAAEDGAVVVQSNAHYGTYIDLEGSIRNEVELVSRYREMANHPELEMAIEEINNEAIVKDDFGRIININLDKLDQSENIKKKIQEEFKTILKLLNFKNLADDIFKRWYIDGRLNYQIVVDKENPQLGIEELRYIDPRKIRKIREIIKDKDPTTGAMIIKSMSEYYVYNDQGTPTQHYTAGSNQGIKISPDSILNVNSGLMDAKNTFVISYLHSAIKPLNQLRMIEDAMVIYRLSRSTEKIIFYIDVGNLPKGKAEQYLHNVMVKYRNKVVYEACLSLDTKIPLLDGRELTLSEIIKEHTEGKELWAYSCDPKTGKFAPGIISWAGVTKKDQRVVKITLDNGEEIICTPDHKFPVWDKGFVEAKDLIIGESMIPFYTRYNKMSGKSNSPYKQLYENNDKKWKYVHRLVSKWKDNRKKHSKKQTIIYNNIFDDIVIECARKNLTVKNTISKINKNIDLKPWINLNKNLHIRNRKNITEFTHKDLTRVCNYLGFSNFTECKNHNLYRNHKVISVEYLDDTMDVGTLTIDKDEKYHDYHTFALSSGIYTKNSTGQLKDDRKHISLQESFFLPRREGGKGTEITTLPAGPNLSDIEDIKYFRNKLLNSLKVPISRLEPQEGGMIGIGRTTEVTRDEVKFAKFIDKLRNKFTRLFDNALEIQLALKGICTRAEWENFREDISYTFLKDNNFTELKESELLRERLTSLSMIDPYIGKYYSNQWVRRNILRQTDEEIKEEDELIKDEEEKGITSVTQDQNQEPEEINPDDYPPEDNVSENMETITPVLDKKIDKYSQHINNRS